MVLRHQVLLGEGHRIQNNVAAVLELVGRRGLGAGPCPCVLVMVWDHLTVRASLVVEHLDHDGRGLQDPPRPGALGVMSRPDLATHAQLNVVVLAVVRVRLDVEQLDRVHRVLVVPVHLLHHGLELVEAEVLEQVRQPHDRLGLGLVLQVVLAVLPDRFRLKPAELDGVVQPPRPVDEVVVDHLHVVAGHHEQGPVGEYPVQDRQKPVLRRRFAVIFLPALGVGLLELVQHDHDLLIHGLDELAHHVAGDVAVHDDRGNPHLARRDREQLGQHGLAAPLEANQEHAGGLVAVLVGRHDPGDPGHHRAVHLALVPVGIGLLHPDPLLGVKEQGVVARRQLLVAHSGRAARNPHLATLNEHDLLHCKGCETRTKGTWGIEPQGQRAG